jgi:GNAT superfamily N-acetyltransferase
MLITLAEPADIPELCGLLELLFTQESEFTPDPERQRRGLRSIIQDADVGQILVARDAGRVVGMINVLYTVSTALGGRVAIFEDMIVIPEARGIGVGSRLLTEAADLAARRGCLRASLLADADNPDAHRFYRRHGFERSGMVTFRLPLTPRQTVRSRPG